MKQNLQFKLSQHLALTPQLQQSIKLLQLSTIELNQELENIVQENPLLEWEETGLNEEPSFDASGPSPSESPSSNEGDFNVNENDDGWDGQAQRSQEWDDDSSKEDYFTLEEPPNLIDYLSDQLRVLPLSEKDKLIISHLIANIDDDGYLDIELDELLQQFPNELEIEIDDLKICQKLLQTLDPVGIGAHNLSECLILQLNQLHANHPSYELAVAICRDHLPFLAHREYGKLKKLFQIDEKKLKSCLRLITQLNPKPAEKFFQQDTRYVVPDILVKKRSGKWIAQLNPHVIPKLKINRLYANLLQRNKSDDSLSHQLQEARWLIKNIQQRFETILKVSQAVINEQQQFFEHGEIAMRPLVLKEIADLVGLHESTISRVTSQKYMLSPKGMYELKYFFSSHVSTENGGAASSTAIRALIKQLVANENPKKPLSDNQISDILNKQGIVVARRTVAKYRESMQINPANQRKIM